MGRRKDRVRGKVCRLVERTLSSRETEIWGQATGGAYWRRGKVVKATILWLLGREPGCCIFRYYLGYGSRILWLVSKRLYIEVMLTFIRNGLIPIADLIFQLISLNSGFFKFSGSFSKYLAFKISKTKCYKCQMFFKKYVLISIRI